MKFLVIAFGVLFSSGAWAGCQILNSQGRSVSGLEDALFVELSATEGCPQDVFDLKRVLTDRGYTVSPSMVANRGRHNPRFGSFSLFEMVTGNGVEQGQFFFGHFTGAAGGQLVLDQAPSPRKLMIELIVWDKEKQYYNFYELIGTRTGGQWFYRGDSEDAFLDNELLKRQPNPKNPTFGARMRCSGCHTSGGPIMKELEFPHNDWWTASRPLPFGNNQPSAELQTWIDDLVDASEFSQAVKKGMNALEKSAKMKAVKKRLSLQEQLRPLFCAMEINLVSAAKPNQSTEEQIDVPAEFWINPLLGGEKVPMSKALYQSVLREKGMRFPENGAMDADHPFLAPVKGHSDLLAIQSLIDDGVVDEELVADVLAVDMQNPLFSQARCELLALVPAEPSEWQETFVQNLRTAEGEAAAELLENISLPEKTKSFHAARAARLLSTVADSAESGAGMHTLVERLQQVRQSVFADEISQNPRGQILEPGFRVIFPMFR